MLARIFILAIAVALGVAGLFLYPKLQSSANLEGTDRIGTERATVQRAESSQQNELSARRSARADASDASVQHRPTSGAARLNAEEDLGAMIRSLARQALDGDRGAQSLIARAMWLCSFALPGLAHQPETVLPNHITEQNRRIDERCKSIRAKDPFSDLPAREGGYSFLFWLDRAASSGDPVALAMRALRDVAQAPSDSQDAARARAQSDLLTAARSRDPEAFFYIGLALPLAEQNAGVRTVAWLLLACRKTTCGDIPEPMFLAPCPPGLGKECDRATAVLHQFESDLGPNKYAAAVELSYEIEDAIDKGRWEQLDLRF